jgi:hypothetical protein
MKYIPALVLCMLLTGCADVQPMLDLTGAILDITADVVDDAPSKTITCDESMRGREWPHIDGSSHVCRRHPVDGGYRWESKQ